MVKEYQNENLKQYFEKYVGEMSVDKKYQPLLVDILLRRSYQYQLTPEEIQKDMETLMYSLEHIVYKDMHSKTLGGCYYPTLRKIDINSVTNEQDKEEFYSTLSHEVYHALTKERDGSDRLGGINQFTKYPNHILLEAFVEKASYKTVYNTEQKDIYNNNGNYNSRGYGDITFIVDAIEATYGVHEQAILRNAIQSRDKLAEFLSNSIGEDKEDTMKFLDAIEVSYTNLHRVRYGNEEISPEEEIGTISDSISSIKNICADKMRDRIELCKPQNMKDIKDFTESMKFDINKLNFIFDERAGYFDKALSYKYNQDFNIRESVNLGSYFGTRMNMNRIDEFSQIVRSRR